LPKEEMDKQGQLSLSISMRLPDLEEEVSHEKVCCFGYRSGNGAFVRIEYRCKRSADSSGRKLVLGTGKRRPCADG
jgi:hypothetical protein